MEVYSVCGGAVMFLDSEGFIAFCRPVNERSLLNSQRKQRSEAKQL